MAMPDLNGSVSRCIRSAELDNDGLDLLFVNGSEVVT
jgi:hypothetical protein